VLFRSLVNGKWVELAGSGIFRPEVTQPLGVNVPVLAWGIGFGRLAMIKLGITDMRDLFNHDLEWLKNKRMVY
jgi:phenylalanyl-tRNA synthetase alpha chain